MKKDRQLEKKISLMNACPAKAGRRSLSFCIDLVIFLIVSCLLSFASSSITKESEAYKASQSQINDEISYYNSYIEPTHLVSFIDGESNEKVRKDNDVLVFENICKAIYLSYKEYEENASSHQYDDFVIDSSSKLAKYGTASLVNDDLSYFYTQYVPSTQNSESHPGTIISFQGNSPTLYLNNLYKNSGMGSLFSYGDMDKMPTMYSNISYSIFIYLTQSQNEVNEKVYSTGENAYSTFYYAYSSLLGEAEEICIKDEPYYSSHYLVYRDSINTQARLLNLSILVSILITYLLIILLPKLIFSYSQTIGRKCLGLYIANENGDKESWLFLLIQSILGLFGYIPVSVIMYMFPPFNGIFDAMFTPFIGNISFLWVIVIIFILVLANYLPCLFLEDRQSLLERGFKLRLVDSKNQIEIEEESKTQGRDY